MPSCHEQMIESDQQTDYLLCLKGILSDVMSSCAFAFSALMNVEILSWTRRDPCGLGYIICLACWENTQL